MKFSKVTLLLALACTTFACKKDSEDPQPTKAQLLTGKKWQLRSLVQSYPGSPDFDIYTVLTPCQKDDYRKFDAPNTSIYDEGPTKCGQYDPQTQLGVWAFSNNDTQLTITDPVVGSETYAVAELTSTSLKIVRTLPQSTGINSTQTFTFVVIP